MIVSKLEVALLVLAYLKEEKYKETYEAFQKETNSFLGRINPNAVNKECLISIYCSIEKTS